jgi:3-methyladenine DNA glycosylase AlkD
MQAEEIVLRLRGMGELRNVENKAKRFGITAEKALGVNQKELKIIAKEVGTNNELAIALFETGIYEARLLCSKIFNPNDLTEALMEYWASTFENWEICDSFCMGFFARSDHARNKALEWSRRPELFVKRAAFAIMASYGFAHKDAPNEVFEEYLELIRNGSSDERHYVRKAVNWALRNIGKRNPDLRRLAVSLANELKMSANSTPKWIGTDALRELSNPELKLLNYPRSTYGAKR